MDRQKRTRSLPGVQHALRKVYEVDELPPDQKADWDALLGKIK